jgi:hypothetical protein
MIKTHQILGFTCNNASNNNTMVETMATILSHFSGEANRARCLAHIVNLVSTLLCPVYSTRIQVESRWNPGGMVGMVGIW